MVASILMVVFDLESSSKNSFGSWASPARQMNLDWEPCFSVESYSEVEALECLLDGWVAINCSFKHSITLNCCYSGDRLGNLSLMELNGNWKILVEK